MIKVWNFLPAALTDTVMKCFLISSKPILSWLLPSDVSVYSPDAHYSASKEKSCHKLTKIHRYLSTPQGPQRLPLFSALLGV